MLFISFWSFLASWHKKRPLYKTEVLTFYFISVYDYGFVRMLEYLAHLQTVAEMDAYILAVQVLHALLHASAAEPVAVSIAACDSPIAKDDLVLAVINLGR
jgi:hypothetical protein